MFTIQKQPDYYTVIGGTETRLEPFATPCELELVSDKPGHANSGVRGTGERKEGVREYIILLFYRYFTAGSFETAVEAYWLRGPISFDQRGRWPMRTCSHH
jgi:hypothetical protein